MSDTSGAGRKIGPYRLDSMLGEGGAARTWLAIDERDQKRYAIKELQLVKSSNAKQVELFERECAILKELEHPQIPRFIETIVERRAETMSLFLVQELVDGRSLQQILDAGAQPSSDDVVAIMRSCLGPLEYLHGRAKPLYHRDLKPSNILLRNDGTCVLVDFGAVREAIADPRTGGSSVVGTFGYMAPEQFQARAYPSTDLYALGATALHLATSRDPGSFEIKRLKPDFHAAMKDDVHLAAILDLLLEPAVEDRYASTHSLLRALDRWQATRADRTDASVRLRRLLDQALANEALGLGTGGAASQNSARPKATSLPKAVASSVSSPAAASVAVASAPGAATSASAPVVTPVPPVVVAAAPPAAPTAVAAPEVRAAKATTKQAPKAAAKQATKAPAKQAARGPTKPQTAAAAPRAARSATVVPVKPQRSSVGEALVPGGQGGRQAGLAVIAMGAAVIAYGMFGGMQYNAHVPVIIGVVVCLYGVILAGFPRRKGQSGSDRLRTVGRTGSPRVTQIRRRISAFGGAEWYADYEYEATDGLHYAASFRLPSAKAAQQVATTPDSAVVRYDEDDPSASILVVRG